MHRWSQFSSKMRFFIFLVSHLRISNNFFWVISIFNWAENCTEFNFMNQIKMNISTFVRFQTHFFAISKNCQFPAYQLVEGASKPQRGARFGNIRESASHHVYARSPLDADWSCTGITLRQAMLYESCEALFRIFPNRAPLWGFGAPSTSWWTGKCQFWRMMKNIERNLRKQKCTCWFD